MYHFNTYLLFWVVNIFNRLQNSKEKKRNIVKNKSSSHLTLRHPLHLPCMFYCHQNSLPLPGELYLPTAAPSFEVRLGNVICIGQWNVSLSGQSTSGLKLKSQFRFFPHFLPFYHVDCQYSRWRQPGFQSVLDILYLPLQIPPYPW